MLIVLLIAPAGIVGLWADLRLSLIHISEPTRLLSISYAVFCLKKKKKKEKKEKEKNKKPPKLSKKEKTEKKKQRKHGIE